MKIGTINTHNNGEADIYFRKAGIEVDIAQGGCQLTLTVEDLDEIMVTIDEHLDEKDEK